MVARGTSGFDSQFSDLAQMAAAGPPSAKKPRVPSSVRPGAGAQGSRGAGARGAAPLQFTFSSRALPQDGGGSKWVARPQLVSQAPPAEDDWGEDGEDAELLVAASQADLALPPAPSQVDQEDLLAMTALMGDDDFDLEDMEEDGSEAERLNQTVTVFAAPETFKAPPPKLVEPKVQGKKEEEKLKRLNMKYQGETAFLRGQMKKKEEEVEAERVARRRVEGELQERLERERKAREAEVAAVRTEKEFILQEMQQLKEKVKWSVPAGEGRRGPGSQLATQGKGNGFPETCSRPRAVNCVETQTSLARRRVARLARPHSETTAGVRALCSVAPLQAGDKARLLLSCPGPGVAWEVEALLDRTLVLLREGGQGLEVLQGILDTCGNLVGPEQRTAVTEACSNLLSDIINTKETKLLPEVLALLSSTWAPGLQEQDITAYVLSLLSRLLSLPCLDSPATASLLVSLVARVGQDQQQAALLCCQSKDECFLACIPNLVIRAEAGVAAVQEAATSSLCSWVLAATSLQPLPPYLALCPWCSLGLVLAVSHLARFQLKRLLALGEGEGRAALLSLVSRCLSALARQQEVLRGGPGSDDSVWLDLINSDMKLQRSYMWTMEQAQLFEEELGEVVAGRLQLLVLEQHKDSDSQEKWGEEME